MFLEVRVCINLAQLQEFTGLIADIRPKKHFAIGPTPQQFGDSLNPNHHSSDATRREVGPETRSWESTSLWS